jgi:hypothetical protein
MKLLKFLFLVLLCFQASAGEWTSLTGISKFTPHGDGVWYQKAFPYELRMSSPSMGLRYDTTGPLGLKYGAGFMRLGSVKTSAEAVALDGVAPDDGGYNPATKACNGTCWPTSHWYGSGQVQGVFGAVGKSFGPWTIETGLYLYRPTWTMDIPDMVWCRQCERVALRVGDAGKWNIGPMVGLRYRIDKWSLNLSAWHTTTRGTDYPSIYHNMTTNLSVGYSF